MFITTQHSHTIASDGYKQPIIRTGYEFVVGRRNSKMFCTAAEEDGIVESISDSGLVIKYQNGEKDGIPLGRQYGKAEGTVYPHDLIATVKQGDKFKKGDILAYNTKFFEPDFKNPKEVVLKAASTADVVFIEEPSTHEDSTTISPSLSGHLSTEVSKIKSYVVRFGQNIHELKKPGSMVDPKDILMVIEDEISASSGQFSEKSLETLKRLSNISPRAGVSGKIEKIEVFYHGEKEDMTETLKAIADKSDRDLAQSSKAIGEKPVTGRVTSEYRVSGKPLELDTAEIKIYLSIKANTGVGDKLIFGHQMKCTIAEVHSGQVYTDHGKPIDAIFAYRSLAAREVNSATTIGTAATYLELVTDEVIKTFEGKLS